LAKAAIILMSRPPTAAPNVAVPPVYPKCTSPVLSEAIKVGDPGIKIGCTSRPFFAKNPLSCATQRVVATVLIDA
jgi:hypothetical protein